MFSETTKDIVRKKADFTCCWCLSRKDRVEIHHIIPEAENGPDSENNAAPLCPSCHSTLGGNPELRAEIVRRRDHLYELVTKRMNPEWGWPIGLDVPLLDFHRNLSPTNSIVFDGIQFTDKDPEDTNNPPLLYLYNIFQEKSLFWSAIITSK